MLNNFSIDVTQTNKLIKDFDLFIKNADTIMNRSINTGLVAGRTSSLLATRQLWNIKAGDLKSHTKTIKAHKSNNNTGRFIVKSGSISLMEFDGRQLDKYGKNGLKRKYKKRERGSRGGTGRAGTSFKLHKDKVSTKLPHSWVAKGKYGVAMWREDPNNPRKRIYMASITPTSMYKADGVDEFWKSFRHSFLVRYYKQTLKLTKPK